MKWTFAGDFSPVSYLLSDLEFQSDHQLDHFLDRLGVIDSITGSPGRIRLGDLNDPLPCGNQRTQFLSLALGHDLGPLAAVSGGPLHQIDLHLFQPRNEKVRPVQSQADALGIQIVKLAG